MDLVFLGPALVVLGIVLVHLALRADRDTHRPPAITAPRRPPASGRRPAASARGEGSTTLRPEDVLLADVLTDLIDVRQEMARLQARLDALQKPPARPARSRDRASSRVSPQGV